MASRIMGGKRIGEGGIWQGDIDDARKAQKNGFDVVVFCAMEAQPDDYDIWGLIPTEVLKYPFDDAELDDEHMAAALGMAREVATRVNEGKKVLVTCYMGWNRSGFVVALAMHMLTGAGGDRIVERIRKKRGSFALSNKSFEKAVRALQPRLAVA